MVLNPLEAARQHKQIEVRELLFDSSLDSQSVTLGICEICGLSWPCLPAQLIEHIDNSDKLESVREALITLSQVGTAMVSSVSVESGRAAMSHRERERLVDSLTDMVELYRTLVLLGTQSEEVVADRQRDMERHRHTAEQLVPTPQVIISEGVA